MKFPCLFASALLLSLVTGRAEIKVVVEHNDNEHSSASFKFENVPAALSTDAATRARFIIVDGERDENGGELAVLHDGKLPTEEDQPGANFFFSAGTEGGRLLLDLARVLSVNQLNTYSWHPNTRGPQVYVLYASDGKAEGFNSLPKKGTDLEKSGWRLIAKVDTRKGEPGGQYGVSISDSDGALGSYRYFLFDISRTETDDAFGNTFYSEIDVVSKDAGEAVSDTSATSSEAFTIKSAGDYCTISIDTSGAPELKEWAEKKLAPVLAEWYPKLTAMLPSEGYEPPKQFRVLIRPGNGVAATGGTRVTANSTWLKPETNPEAIGALLHEEVHVVQQYRGGRNNPNRAPGWLVEGIPDYIRWFKYEPQSHGADTVFFAKRRNANLNYDGLYRVTANFLNYVIEHYDKEQTLITKLNAVCRQGKYSDDLWKESTGKTLAELNTEWKEATQKLIAAEKSASGSSGSGDRKVNALTDAEKTAGWKLLFNGQDLSGWHNFRQEGVRAGWQVKDGTLVCADPHNAGDIVTAEQFDWFDLQLDYNISEGGNSGIMYHVTDAACAAWATGPEFQLEDNAKAADPVRCGWLYALYQPPIDDKTGKPLDATKPVGEWNHIRLLITPQKCMHEINGVKYFEYVLGSEDFTNRVAKSKFRSMPGFAKFDKGYIALQGDHGQVSFRNIKLLPIKAEQ